MNNCTWCSGQGIIRRPYSLNKLNIIEWSFVLGSYIAVMTFLRFFGSSHGMTSLILVLGLVILVPIIQVSLWIIGVLGLFTEKIPCPHCKTNNSGDLS